MKKQKRLSMFPALPLLLALIASLTPMSVPQVQAADVLIDTFAYTSTEADYTIPAPLPTFPVLVSNASAAGVAEVLGGQREVCLDVLEGLSGSRARLRTDAVNDYLDMDLSSGVRAIAVLQWDGAANTACTLDPIGLGGVDLTDNGSSAGVLLRVVASDSLLVVIKVRIYTDGGNWAESSLNFESRVQSPSQAVDLFLPFADFDHVSGTAVFTDVGAVELELNASAADSAGADMTIKMFKASSIHDYGDLPILFGADVLNARHIVQGMRLGYSVDAEAGNYTSTMADGDDDNDFDDEDGVTRRNRNGSAPAGDPNWAPGSSGADGSVRVIARGCSDSTPCYIAGWIDWDRDFAFDDPGEKVVEEFLFSNTDGTNYGFEIPAGTGFEDVRYYARFRICPAIWDQVGEDWLPGDCDSPTAPNVRNGEVEDYTWDWGSPTAVKLTSFTAAPAGGAVLIAWETASEHDNAGFHLYRSTAAGVHGERLNQHLIPSASPGGDQGAIYAFTDTTARPGQTYYYTLEDVDLSGVRTPHGPVEITTPYTIFLPLVRR